jgi:lipopolysaccharide export system permease protein
LSRYLAVAVAALSLIARPFAYQKLHALSARSAAVLNVNALEAGNFYIGDNGNRVIYVAHRAGPGSPGRDVFVQLRYGDHTEIISAPAAYPVPGAAPGAPDVYLTNAHIYEIGDGTGQPDQIISVQGFTLHPDRAASTVTPYSSAAASSTRLAASHSAQDTAELQWRLSTPLSTLLLGLLAIPLSRSKPRQGKYAKFGTAILVYSGYYLLCMSARTWVQDGTVSGFPGIWWAPALLALFLLAAMFGPDLLFRYRAGRA